MELCDEYLHGYIQLYPPLNVLFISINIFIFEVLPDIYSDLFMKQETKLAKRYENVFQKDNWDTLFEYDEIVGYPI